MIKTGHLCSGYDGLGLALDEVEPHVAEWHAEIDPAASRLLAREYPDVPNAGNLVQVLLDGLWSLAPDVDLITAGFPCQPVSAAGRQLAQLDPRWLWPFILRILREKAPFRLFIENVQNLVSIQDGRVFREILADLRAAGYAARWVVMGACVVGAPHHRHRVFLVADLVGAGAPEAVRIGDKALCGAPRSGGRWLLPTPKASDDKGAGVARMAEGKKPWADLSTAVALLPTPRATDVGTPGRRSSPDWRPQLGQAVLMLPTPAARDGGDRGTPSAEHAQRRLDGGRTANLEDVVALLPTPMSARSGNNRGGAGGRGDDQPVRPSLDSIAHLLPTPTASNAHGNTENGRGELLLPGVAMLPTPRASDGERGRGNCTQAFGSGAETLGAAASPERWGKYAEAVLLWEQITGIPAPEPSEPSPRGSRRLAAALPEWMMGLAPGYLTKGNTRAEALKLAGNGVVPAQAAAAYRLLT